MSISRRWNIGAEVLWRSVKDGNVLFAQAMRVVRDDDDLVALYVSPGTQFKRWADSAFETHTWSVNRVLILYRPGKAHSVGLFWRDEDGVLAYWYVNLEQPWQRSSRGFDSWDHVLDLVVAPDLSSWHWKDEKEFAAALREGSITNAEADAIRTEAEDAIADIRRRASTYSDGRETWLPDPGWPIPELPANWRVVE